MADASTAQRNACYVTRERDDDVVAVAARCGFDLRVLEPRAIADAPADTALLLVDAGCAGDEATAARLLGEFPVRGGRLLLLGAAGEQAAWEHWVRSGEAIFLRQPVAADYLESLLRDIQGEIPVAGAAPEAPAPLDQFGLLLGSSAPMRDLYRLLRKAAASNAAVCVHGESGTGKELVARSLHVFSGRRREPFCAINCGAMPSELVESELFGHERGSFSGAERRHQGLFERAGAGTVLLDELTEMPEDTQVKLLRVLETGHFRRVGGEEDQPWSARLVTATNREPGEAVAAGRLREDLYYRVRELEVRVPALRERGEDIIALARRFMADFSAQSGRPVRLGADAEQLLREYHWPGNVRELRHVVQTACRLCRSVITPAHLASLEPAPPRGSAPGGSGPALAIAPGMTVAEAERRLILATLDAENGDRRRAAESLGISVRTLYNRLAVYRAAGTGG